MVSIQKKRTSAAGATKCMSSTGNMDYGNFYQAWMAVLVID
jgi:hypothetical protein